MDVRSRHHLRSDEISQIRDRLASSLGVTLDGESFESVELDGTEFDLVLVDGEPFVMYLDDEPFLTVAGANAFPPASNTVTVDAGAVSFVSNGADVMRPGITAADESITPGDLVAVREETHQKTLAVGRALVDGDEMVGSDGKVVESIHHVGDELFEFDI